MSGKWVKYDSVHSILTRRKWKLVRISPKPFRIYVLPGTNRLPITFPVFEGKVHKDYVHDLQAIISEG